ncbi:hypothetical protein D6779_10380 [Candidatus Parcubacteria bacterium]|nr:MAG: hypothetical protein D6779_10380 [Candidatus Parcubacteria bacterium]
MPTPSPEIIHLLSVFAIAFTVPTFKNMMVLTYGAILSPGRRTVAAALRVLGLEDRPDFGKYHRVLNRARWKPLLLSRLLLGLIIGLCLPDGAPLTLVVDETLERRWGRKIKYKGLFRDPIRSTKKKVVHSPGLRWLCLSSLVTVPWSRRPWALPFLTVLLLSPQTSAKLGQRHRTSVDRAGQLFSLVRRWHPDREIIIAADGGFAAVPLVQHCQRKHIKVRLVSRLRLDARLFDAPEPQPKGKRGPKPKKGPRQPSLQQRLQDPNTIWTRLKVTWYGGEKKEIEYCSGTSLWHRVGLAPVPIRWVIVRYQEKNQTKHAAFFSSSQTVSAQQIIECFVQRWNIEVTFEEVRAHLGFETQRQWSDKAIQRSTPALFGLFSLVVLMALRLHPQKLPYQSARWYDKQEATFGDALAAVRNHLWQLDNYSISPDAADAVLIPAHLFRALRHLALQPL